MQIDPVVATLAATIGGILAWFMGRVERRLDRVSTALDRFSRVMLLEIVSRPGVSLAVTREATSLLREMHDERERDRNLFEDRDREGKS